MGLILELLRRSESCTLDFCVKYNELVDSFHIDECNLIFVGEIKISEMTSPLESVYSIWEITPSKL